MPNTDIRIQVTFPAHWKTRKLERLAGDAGVKCLIFLWCFTGVNKCDGILTGMSDLDIEDAAYWTGIPKQFVTALIECGFLEGEENDRLLHDWKDHNKWCAEFSIRSERNRKSIESRWNTSRIQDEYETNTSCSTTSKVRKGKEGKGKAGKVTGGSGGNSEIPEGEEMPADFRKVSDCYQAEYLKRFNKKPPWGKPEGKHIRELLDRYPVEDILWYIPEAFKGKDELITPNLGAFRSCCSFKFIDRLLPKKDKAKKPENQVATVKYLCDESPHKTGEIYSMDITKAYLLEKSGIVEIVKDGLI